MVCHARNNIEIGHIAARDDQMVVMQARATIIRVGKLDFAFRKIDRLHLFRAAKDPRQHLPQRDDDIQRVDR